MLENIINNIDSILNHLKLYLPLANVHMVDYFTQDVYNKFIPDDIQNEAQRVGHPSVVNSIFNNKLDNLPSTKQYIDRNRELSLKHSEVCTDMNSFESILQKLGCDSHSRLKLNVFMSPKKSHEVEILSSVAAAVREVSNVSHIVDIGDGRGYLSSMLAMHHKIPVLGIDASRVNTNSAAERVRKLSKVWNSLVSNNKGDKETSSKLYKQTTQFIDHNADFTSLITAEFNEDITGICLVGLHTCGNLAANSLKLYNSNKKIRSICNVGCCYHLLNEEFDIVEEVSSDFGFPLSNYLCKKQVSIGRAARMIAAQSIDRIMHVKQLPNQTIFYRSLLEIIIERKCPNLPKKDRQVGRFRKECKSFVDYYNEACRRLKLNPNMSEHDVNMLYEEYKHRQDEVNTFYILRAMIAPVIEHLILLDRLLFLFEQGYEHSYLIEMFNPVLSPRCYGIVSIKL